MAKKRRVGWFCDSCGAEVEEWVSSISSAGGGSIGSGYFKHPAGSKCDYQRATTAYAD